MEEFLKYYVEWKKPDKIRYCTLITLTWIKGQAKLIYGKRNENTDCFWEGINWIEHRGTF